MTERSSWPQGTEEEVGAGQQAGPTAPEASPLEGDVVQESGAQASDASDDQPEGAAEGHPDTALAAERLVDLQRLQAEYVNYKRRVDRDRAVVQERAARSVIEALLPVLDDIHAAREHGDLEGGPFSSIADKLEATLGKFGLERYGAVGEEFDPSLHEALMHTAWPQDGSVASTGSTTVVQVLQPGYRAGEQVLRAARVAVADPE
ncbi:molecular chaperone GrpE [Phycicoccus sp. Root563]|uniref:nucleotide exchange factor GrpE n=1 Tax=Phycicoccus sp. Root563 TaxID=1736562 RepID=UPI0007037A94|nr:nucleotide exchange factor GrpE [Phycicoccus sp. Root563]KQZ90004.1 molecular chaperone GrpE [Phycicoccus sp. Root563]